MTDLTAFHIDHCFAIDFWENCKHVLEISFLLKSCTEHRPYVYLSNVSQTEKQSKGAPLYFCVMRFGVIFLRENVNLMYFVRDVVIESLVVIRYRDYLCT